MILITGATGNVGQPLISALHRTGATIRAVSRNPAKAVMSTIPHDPAHWLPRCAA
jgi:uncharacterized protein YbjT (DUF2867 family)